MVKLHRVLHRGLEWLMMVMTKRMTMLLAGHVLLWNLSHEWAALCPHVCLKNVTVLFPASIRGFVCLREGWGNSMLSATDNNLCSLYCQPTPRKWENFATPSRESEVEHKIQEIGTLWCHKGRCYLHPLTPRLRAKYSIFGNWDMYRAKSGTQITTWKRVLYSSVNVWIH